MPLKRNPEKVFHWLSRKWKLPEIVSNLMINSKALRANLKQDSCVKRVCEQRNVRFETKHSNIPPSNSSATSKGSEYSAREIP